MSRQVLGLGRRRIGGLVSFVRSIIGRVMGYANAAVGHRRADFASRDPPLHLP